jgi:hypothetical protein
MVKQISSIEFHTLFRKDPNFANTNLGKAVFPRIREEEFWSDEEETVLGVLVHDIPDNDWTGMVLVRNEHGRFRAKEPTLMSPDKAKASSALQERVAEIAAAGLEEVADPDMDEAFLLVAMEGSRKAS